MSEVARLRLPTRAAGGHSNGPHPCTTASSSFTSSKSFIAPRNIRSSKFFSSPRILRKLNTPNTLPPSCAAASDNPISSAPTPEPSQNPARRTPIQEFLACFEPEPRTAFSPVVDFFSIVKSILKFAARSAVLVLYLSFWWLIVSSVWERTGTAWALAIPLALTTFSDWDVLKALSTCYFATALNAWPLVIGRLTIDFIHYLKSHRLQSFAKSVRVLAAVLGRNLRAPVMANYTWLSYGQDELSGFEPITGPLADNTDTTVFKWQNLFDIVWMVAVIWFLYAHIVCYEQMWGDLFRGTGFTYSRLGTWHMPEFPQYWKPVVPGPAIQVLPQGGVPNLWGPFPVT